MYSLLSGGGILGAKLPAVNGYTGSIGIEFWAVKYLRARTRVG